MGADWLEVHPLNPQPRLLERAVARVRAGGVIVYPTDSCYALGCRLGDKAAAERLKRIRQFDRHHLFTLVCQNLSELARYARFDNAHFRWLKALTPGPYTFVLRASAEAPRRLLHEKRRTIGLRIPEDRVTQGLLGLLGEPLLSCTLVLPPDPAPPSTPRDVRDRLQHVVDLVIDAGDRGTEPSTVVDFSGERAAILRRGRGDLRALISEGVSEPL